MLRSIPNVGNLGNVKLTCGNFNDPKTYGDALLPLIDAAATTLDEQHWPRAGRYMVVSPYAAGAIRKSLVADRNFLVTPFNDQMLINAQVAKYQDFDIWMDDSMNPATPTGAKTERTQRTGILRSIQRGYRHWLPNRITSGFQESSPTYRGAHFWGNVLYGRGRDSGREARNDHGTNQVHRKRETDWGFHGFLVITLLLLQSVLF